MLESGFIRERALAEGFTFCGLAPYRVLGEQAVFLEKWLSSAGGSLLPYMARDTGKKLDPAFLVPDARTVVVCAVNYKNRFSLEQTANPKIASYALARDYHLTIKEMLQRVLSAVKEKYPGVSGRCFSDAVPMLEKAWAIEAGVGVRGKNSLIITPAGSFVLLGEIVLDAPADTYDTPDRRDPCGDCRRCVDACPNGAVTPDRTVDISRCIACATIEKTLSDAPLHGWIFGCDECLAACPHNAAAPQHANQMFDPVVDPGELTRERWLAMTEEEFFDIFRHTPLSRTSLDKIKKRL